MNPSPFDAFPDIYDSLIDWPKRLANEGPFYRDLFERLNATSVLDTACGTGRHAALFRSWNKRVEASDVSPQMIKRARETHGESSELRWAVRGFEEPARPDTPFDVAICVGNSLALAQDTAVVEGAIHNMLAAVRVGGAIVVHVLNLWRLPDGPTRWQKFAFKETCQGTMAIAKGVHRAGGRGFVDLLVIPTTSGEQPRTQCITFLGLHASDLQEMVRRAGAVSVQLLGGYQDQPYDSESSVDLILVAKK